MSEFQFSDLLVDFGESKVTTTTTTTTSKSSSHGVFDDDFDPFGPSSGTAQTSNGRDSGLLFDLSSDSEIKNGEISGGADFQSSASNNPFLDMSTSAESSNPLYDLETESSNPLYDLSDVNTNESSNPLYEFTTETTIKSESLSSPLYNTYDNDEAIDEAAEEVDLLSGTNEQQVEDVDNEEADQAHYDDSDFDVQQEGAEEQQEVVNLEYESPVLNGEAHHWVGVQYETPEEQPEEKDDDDDHSDDDDAVHHQRVEVVEEDSCGEATKETTMNPEYESSEDDEETIHLAVSSGKITQTSVQLDIQMEENLASHRQAEQLADSNVRKVVGGEDSGDTFFHRRQLGHFQQELLDSDHFSRDRAEEDLENYCLNREESDHTEDPDEVLEELTHTMKSKERRSWSSSRSFSLDMPDEGMKPEQNASTNEEVDTLRPRKERRNVPKRSLEPEETLEEQEFVEDGRTVSRTTRTESRYSGSGAENTRAVEDFSSNHWDADRSHQNISYGRQPGEQDIIHFSEMTTTKNRFESEPEPTPAPRRHIDVQKEVLSAEGGVYESEPQTFHQWQNETEEEEGVYESQPLRRDDVVREADSDKIADLPPVGTAQSMRAKFMTAQNESTTRTKYESTASAHGTGSEHVSEPRSYVEKYESRAESGVFESEPVINPDVVRSGDELKEELPERGMAKNLANMFRQISSEHVSTSSSGGKAKREIIQELSTRSEYVSEPQVHHVNEYDVRVDAGVFENQPQRHADVVTSDSVPEDYIPERGFAKNVAAKFRQFESTVKSPPLSPSRRKEFTPPREDIRSHQAVVVENTPEVKSDIVHSTDHLEEALPERGMAKNIAQLFRQMEVENKSPTGPRARKEFTPPPRDAGVYENQPKQFHPEYNRPAESGVIENQPLRRDDVVREDEPPRYEEELPERGAAKNLVNKWRQMESEGAKLKSPGSSGRPKEFTPPRDEPRITQQKKSPRTPLSPREHGDMDNGAVHPSELPGQYQPQIEASVFESSPQQRSDVAREADGDSPDGLPKKDTAKKMLARFQSIQAEASKQASTPVTRRETAVPSKTPRKESECSETEIIHMMENTHQNIEDDNKVGRSKSMRAAIQTEKCGACEKTVYAMERLEMNKRVYHKACFRCTQCKAVLTPKTFAINNDVIFCTTHYKQLFATKGNYDEGFGRVQHKKRWSSNPNLTKDGDDDDEKS